MKTLDELIEILQPRISREIMQYYISREWVRPVQNSSDWHFDDIDIARVELVCHLTQDIQINDQGMDVVLSLLDQLYGMRAHAAQLHQAIERQPETVRAEIKALIRKLNAIEQD